jgi:hypothetical protein
VLKRTSWQPRNYISQTKHCAPARASAHNLGLWPHSLGWLGVTIYTDKNNQARNIFFHFPLCFGIKKQKPNTYTTTCFHKQTQNNSTTESFISIRILTHTHTHTHTFSWTAMPAAIACPGAKPHPIGSKTYRNSTVSLHEDPHLRIARVWREENEVAKPSPSRL